MFPVEPEDFWPEALVFSVSFESRSDEPSFTSEDFVSEEALFSASVTIWMADFAATDVPDFSSEDLSVFVSVFSSFDVVFSSFTEVLFSELASLFEDPSSEELMAFVSSAYAWMESGSPATVEETILPVRFKTLILF